MFKIISAVILAAVITDVGIGVPRATGMIEATGPQRALKSDRLLPPNGPECIEAAWPHYETHCVRSQRQPNAMPREVRIVASDRLPPKHPAALSVN